MSMIPEGRVLYFFCRLAVGLLSLALVSATALPFVGTDARWIRLFDFPRLQITVLLGLTLAGYAALRDAFAEAEEPQPDAGDEQQADKTIDEGKSND